MCASSAPASPASRLPTCLPKLGSRWSCSTTARIGSGQTAATTAHLVNALDDRYFRARAAARRARRAAGRPRATPRRSIASRASSTRERIECDFKRARRLPVLRARARRGVSRSRARRGASRRAARRRRRSARAPLAVRHRPVPALSEPGAVPSAEVPRGPGRGDRARRRAHLHRHARDHDRRRQATPRVTTKRRHRHGRQHRRRHQRAGQRSASSIHTKQAPYMTYVIGAPRAARTR